jgi:hypothetical protein
MGEIILDYLGGPDVITRGLKTQKGKEGKLEGCDVRKTGSESMEGSEAKKVAALRTWKRPRSGSTPPGLPEGASPACTLILLRLN